MISFSHVSFAYPGGAAALYDVSVSFSPGRLTALLGPNGAGKSTLLRCALGSLVPQKGSILWNGQDLLQKTPGDRAAVLSYVPQQGVFSPDMKVWDFVLMGALRTLSLFSLPGDAQRESTEKALRAMGLFPLKERRMGEISGGERQRALIARALCQDTPVILMDEPASSLDYGYQKRLMEEAGKLARQGKTVLMSLHQPQWALSYADEAVILENGRVAASGLPDQVMGAPLLERIYGVPVTVYEIDGKKIIC